MERRYVHFPMIGEVKVTAKPNDYRKVTVEVFVPGVALGRECVISERVHIGFISQNAWDDMKNDSIALTAEIRRYLTMSGELRAACVSIKGGNDDRQRRRT